MLIYIGRCNMLMKLLVELKMHGALSCLDKLSHAITDKEQFIVQLLEAELRYKKERSMKRRMGQAKFPVEKEWIEIDYTLNPKIDFKRVQNHFDGAFVERKRNLCLIGTQGTGKTHCLISLGRELCRKGKTVKFYTACELVNALEEAKNELVLNKLMKSLEKPSLLIVDELGFVPFSENGARLLFDVFSRRYERGSIAVSTNLSFDKWVEVFGSVELTAALVDRFSHGADLIPFDGQSVRLFQTKNQRIKK